MDGQDEGKSSTHIIIPLDDADVEVASPLTLEYRLMGAINKKAEPVELIGWTNMLSPTNTRKVEISAALNTIDEKGPLRYLTVRGTYMDGAVTKTITAEKNYQLRPLKGITQA